MVATSNISIDREQLADFCRRNRIQKLSLFGSVLRDDFGPESDVDVLVEFEPGHEVGWEIIDIQESLAALLGRQVDLLTPRSLNWRMRNQILGEAQVQYEQR